MSSVFLSRFFVVQTLLFVLFNNLEQQAAGYADLQEWGDTVLNYQATIDNDLSLVSTTWIGTHNSFANDDDDSFSDSTTN